jgi:hypothetical protein
MYMNESQVIYPPAEGWPSIVNADPAKLQDLGKSDEVLSLLAHLPYIRCPGDWNHDADVVPWNSFEDWSPLLKELDGGAGRARPCASVLRVSRLPVCRSLISLA